MTKIKDSFEYRFKYAIEVKNLSFYRLSKITGVSKSTISNYINGRITTPEPKTLEKLCLELDISPNWLLYGSGEMQIHETDMEYISYRKHHSVSESEKEQAITTIKQVFDELAWLKRRNQILETYLKKNLYK